MWHNWHNWCIHRTLEQGEKRDKLEKILSASNNLTGICNIIDGGQEMRYQKLLPEMQVLFCLQYD